MVENTHSTSEVLVLHLEPVQFWILGFTKEDVFQVDKAQIVFRTMSENLTGN